MKYQLFILIIFAFLGCNKGKNSKILNTDKKNDTIKYESKGFNSGIKLFLLKNNSFYYEKYFYGCLGGGESEKVYGKYEASKTELQLFPDSLSIGIIPYTRHGDPIISKLKYGIDSLKIKTSYKFINWKNYEFLISPEPDSLFRNSFIVVTNNYEEYNKVKRKWNNFYELAYYFNVGIELESDGNLLKREKGKIEYDLDLNKIDNNWRFLFLKEPITAKIIEVTKNISDDENEVENYSLVIDKGSKHGINVGVVIFNRKDLEDHIEIVKVFPDKSIGFCYKNEKEIKIGETIKTIW